MKPKDEVRILVVDDQKSMRGLAILYLHQLNYKNVDEAESAQVALAKMQSQKYDVLLLDWNLEGMSGIDLLKLLRSVPELNVIKVIMTTSERSSEKMNQAFELGANQYIGKPYKAEDLDRRLTRVLL